MGSAPGLAAHLARRTILLDWCCRPPSTAPLPPVEEMRAGLAHQLPSVEHGHDNPRPGAIAGPTTWRFHIGVQQLEGTSACLAQAGLAYSDIAAATISAVCDRVERLFAEAHGGFRGQRLAVLGMGSRQPRDVGHVRPRPDLRLRHPARPRASHGRQPLVPIQYYTRLSAKIVTALTAHTNEGALYEVDMRLRPSGRAGPLANSLEGFESYHAQSAWTWGSTWR